MKYEIDDVISAWLDAGTGASGFKFKQPYTVKLLQSAAQEARTSSEGVDLRSRGVDNLEAKVVAELVKRFGSVPFYPGVFFRERWEEVIHDFLSEAPPAPVRPPGVNEHGVNLNFDVTPEKPKPNKDQTAFAHAWNKTTKERGIGAVKPKGGIVTLVMPNGSEYEYRAADADRLLNECIAFGIVS